MTKTKEEILEQFTQPRAILLQVLIDDLDTQRLCIKLSKQIKIAFYQFTKMLSKFTNSLITTIGRQLLVFPRHTNSDFFLLILYVIHC